MLWLLIVILIVILLLIVIFNSAIKRTISCSDTHLGDRHREIIFDNNTSGGLIPTAADFNPSIIALNDGRYLMVVRRSNIHSDNISHLIYNANVSSINKKSKLVFVILDKDFNIISTKDSIPSNTDINYEDGRLFSFNNLFYISAVHYIPDQRIFPVLLEFDNNFNYIRRIDYLIQPSGKEVDRFSSIQKNWYPFAHNGKLLIHTDSYPIWRVRQVTIDGSNYAYVRTILEHNVSDIFSSVEYPLLRCSTSWINFTNTFNNIPTRQSPQGSYLACLHTKTKIGTIRTLFVEIDKESLLPIRKSKLLCLDHNHARLQFTSGLTRCNNDIIISYGLCDTKYAVKVLPYDYIRKLLL